MDLSANYFEIFGFEPAFDIDQQMLVNCYRELQKKLHPDNFAQASDAEKRLSLQYTSKINEAFSVLKSDFERAAYLLSLSESGEAVNDESTVSHNPLFLMEQMELREQLDAVRSEADPFQTIEKLEQAIRTKTSDKKAAFLESYNNGNLDAARQGLQEWQFLEKLKHDLERLEATLD